MAFLNLSLLSLLPLLSLLSLPLLTTSVIVEPEGPQRSINFDPRQYPRGNFELPFDDPLIADTRTDPKQPEQIRVTYHGDTRVLVSWSTEEPQLIDTRGSNEPPQLPPMPTLTLGSSWVKWGFNSGALTRIAVGISNAYSYIDTSSVSYISGVQHHVLISEVLPGRTYFYSVGDSTGHWSPEHTFQSVGASKSLWPFRLGVMADTGVTFNSSATFRSMAKAAPDMLMLVGDLSYADLNTPHFPEGYQKQLAWDFFLRLLSRTLPSTVLMHTNGNHEVEPQEKDGDFVMFEAYNARMPIPQHMTYGQEIPVGPVTRQTASANMYYSVDVAGAHFVFLSSYIPGDDFSVDSEQYKWLEKDLASVNRQNMPWLIVSFHAPIYNSYYSHFKENECFREYYEPLFDRYEVDITYHGHVHAYERSVPVNDYKEVDNGRLSITVGDGGNIEGVAVEQNGTQFKTFIDQYPDEPFCSDPNDRWLPSYQPQGFCVSLQPEDGGYCYDKQPAWSAFREASWGFGILTLINESTATWHWHRVAAGKEDRSVGSPIVADDITIIRGVAASIRLDERARLKGGSRAEAKGASDKGQEAGGASGSSERAGFKGPSVDRQIKNPEGGTGREGGALDIGPHRGSASPGATGRKGGGMDNGPIGVSANPRGASWQFALKTLLGGVRRRMQQDALPSQSGSDEGTKIGSAKPSTVVGGGGVGVGSGSAGRSGSNGNNTGTVADRGWSTRAVAYSLVLAVMLAVMLLA